jgi:transcriptional regulator with XRE-family HTH domain
MAELGNTLSRARRARGITLEEAERDTHVSKRYLQALEDENFGLFPAPVYARGFLRTYSRYLGLNPDELMRIFPNGSLAIDITPLPRVSRPPPQALSINWVIVIAVALFLLGASLLLLRSDDGATSIGSLPSVSDGAATSSQPQLLPAPPQTAPQAQGKPIGPIRPGVVPDFVGADLPSALAVLRDNQYAYVIIEASSANAAPGIILSQSPRAGGRIGANVTIELVVSRGAP